MSQGSSIRACSDDHVEIVHWDDRVGEALERLSASGGRAIVIVDGDRVVALASSAKLRDLHERHGGDAKLRDGISPGVRFCFASDPVETARATMEAAGLDMLAVVDDARRVCGTITRDRLPEQGRGGDVRPSVDPTDRRSEDHPNLQVYAPWASV